MVPSRRWILGRALRSGLLAPRSLVAFVMALWSSGPNLVALLRFGGARMMPGPMLIDDHARVSFTDLADQVEQLAGSLRQVHGVARKQPVAILGANSVMLVRCLFAVSRLGGRAILLNPHLPPDQIDQLLQRHGVDIVLAPQGSVNLPARAGRILCDPAVMLAQEGPKPGGLPRCGPGEIVVLTGGTTGLPKAAARAAGPPSVLRLFLHLLAALRLDERRALYVTVPLFHGFGLAGLIIAVALGRTIHLRERFDDAGAGEFIAEAGIDTILVVPTILQRLLRSGATAALPLRCIVSGGAPLSPLQARETLDRFGEVLFNLYGTSEAGLSAIATPQDLAQEPSTIGRAAWGATMRITGVSGQPAARGEIGELFVRNRASIAPGTWIATGDLASRDGVGRLFLHGRTDDMIVSGGENVSPWEVESVLLRHPAVAEAVAIGVPDAEFGQRLIAIVVPRADDQVLPSGPELAAWLGPRVARHQFPREIIVRDGLPLTGIGKVDRRALAATLG